MIDSQQNTKVNDEAIKGFKTESLSALVLTHCWHKLELKIASTIFWRSSTDLKISKTVHTDHPFESFLFWVFVNVMAVYLYPTGNKKNRLGFAR